MLAALAIAGCDDGPDNVESQGPAQVSEQAQAAPDAEQVKVEEKVRLPAFDDAAVESPDPAGEGARDDGDLAELTLADPYVLPEGAARPDESQLDWADKVLGYANLAQEHFNAGYFHLADVLGNNVENYTHSFQLAERPRNPGAFNDGLKPEQGLFDEDEEVALATGLREMDRALQAMFRKYIGLDKYVKDDTIIDDGKLGNELAADVAELWQKFREERSKWLELVEGKAREAERLLLYDHPLRRQIMAAQDMLEQMAQLDHLGREEAAKGAPELLTHLASLADIASRPPFPASPALERTYRAFLAEVEDYQLVAARALAEGWHPTQQTELRRAENRVRQAYNAFAAAGNGL